MNKLIQCGDHRYAPWAIVCVHLCEQTSSRWLPVPQYRGSECENDWLCPKCIERLPNVPLDHLRAVCVHCIRELMQRADATSPDSEARS